MIKRPDLNDFECYDPQSMQEYMYLVDEYIDYLELNERKTQNDESTR